jgi:hypothetical protein
MLRGDGDFWVSGILSLKTVSEKNVWRSQRWAKQSEEIDVWRSLITNSSHARQYTVTRLERRENNMNYWGAAAHIGDMGARSGLPCFDSCDRSGSFPECRRLVIALNLAPTK